jgi:hypothetical protein
MGRPSSESDLGVTLPCLQAKLSVLLLSPMTLMEEPMQLEQINQHCRSWLVLGLQLTQAHVARLLDAQRPGMFYGESSGGANRPLRSLGLPRGMPRKCSSPASVNLRLSGEHHAGASTRVCHPCLH